MKITTTPRWWLIFTKIGRESPLRELWEYVNMRFMVEIFDYERRDSGCLTFRVVDALINPKEIKKERNRIEKKAMSILKVKSSETSIGWLA